MAELNQVKLQVFQPCCTIPSVTIYQLLLSIVASRYHTPYFHVITVARGVLKYYTTRSDASSATDEGRWQQVTQASQEKPAGLQRTGVLTQMQDALPRPRPVYKEPLSCT